jgi:hypothetical protein
MLNASGLKARLTVHLLLVIVLLTSACNLLTPKTPTAPPAQDETLQATHTPQESTSAGEQAAGPTPTNISVAFKAGPPLRFAGYNEPEVQTGANLPAYTVEAGLANVYVPFLLSAEQVARLVQDGFVVTPGQEKEFFTVYEKARYANVPIFITSDSLLHTYHLMFDKVLRTAERQYFIPLLRDLNAALLATADQQYQALQSTPWAEAALRTVAYFSVASQLLDASVQVPAYATDLASQEVRLVNDASGILPSPIFPYLPNGEDYTQYIPRSHYTLSEDLKAYFKSMMWYGRMTFRIKGAAPEAGLLETRMALLVVQALSTSTVHNRPALSAWADLYEPTAFFVGRSDDLTVEQYADVMEAVYGAGVSVESLLDEGRYAAFVAQASELPPPLILGMVLQDWQDEEAETKGLRFMGQRFVPDAYIFRQLIYRNVGTREDPRMLPKGLDLLAVMGSKTAYQTLEEMGETRYENYVSQMDKATTWLAGLTPQDWTETLYNTWLYSFLPLIDEPIPGLPAFMQTDAWKYKQLNTTLGSWTELKHDTLLYAKQVYAELGGGPPAPEPVPPRGYVEPVPLFFARIAALTEMTLSGLDQRSLLSEEDRFNMQQIATMAHSLQGMAEKELRGEPLTEGEFEDIRYYGGSLEDIVMASADSDVEDPFAPKFMEEEPQAAVVADVATDPNGQVLEEAVGRVDEIHVIVPLIQEDGSLYLQVAKGGVFSYYEFAWPINDRLTDEKWRQMLEEGDIPERPVWVSNFMVQQGEYGDLQQSVTNFQSEITNAYWSVGWMELGAGDPLLYFADDLSALRDATQYMGHQLVSSTFTSYDLQSDTRAVVVAQETWQDTLYAGQYPDFDVPPLGVRGPYVLTATYTLEWTSSEWSDYWKVVAVAVQGAVPDW